MTYLVHVAQFSVGEPGRNEVCVFGVYLPLHLTASFPACKKKHWMQKKLWMQTNSGRKKRSNRVQESLRKGNYFHVMKSSFFCYEMSNLWDISLVSAKFVNFESLCLENLSIRYDRAAQRLFDEVISKYLEFLVDILRSAK